MTSTYLQNTTLLNFSHPAIETLIRDRGWRELSIYERIRGTYNFVQNEIQFGYNLSDDVPASRVLVDGYGQCNTKTTLLMALLRGVGVPCRFHGATISKRLQRGIITGVFYFLSPKSIIHSWAEVRIDGRWVELEGVILDGEYIEGLRESVASNGPLLGYGAGTEDIGDPAIEWNGTNTAIQKTGVNQDLGIYDNPDAFYQQRGTNLSGLRGRLYRKTIRHMLNRRVEAIRRRAQPVFPSES